MSYSCGYFGNNTDTLYDAQCNKINRTLQKLHLEEGMSLCDIGCGWGFLLIQAAKQYKVHGVGITLSEEQKKDISALLEYPGDAWIKKYIFPGGVIPSLREIINIAGELRRYIYERNYRSAPDCVYKRCE